MKNLTRVTFNPAVMGGKPCIRGLRITVGMVVGLMATSHTKADILELYPYLEDADIDEALAYAEQKSDAEIGRRVRQIRKGRVRGIPASKVFARRPRHRS